MSFVLEERGSRVHWACATAGARVARTAPDSRADRRMRDLEWTKGKRTGAPLHIRRSGTRRFESATSSCVIGEKTDSRLSRNPTEESVLSQCLAYCGNALQTFGNREKWHRKLDVMASPQGSASVLEPLPQERKSLIDASNVFANRLHRFQIHETSPPCNCRQTKSPSQCYL